MSSNKQVIAITGVSSGLGLAMVKWYTSGGHVVLGCARSAQKISQLNDEFCKGNKPKQFTVVASLVLRYVHSSKNIREEFSGVRHC